MKKMFKGIKIGMIHGKLSSDEKNKIMDEFKNSDMQVLISTTIIEVGISIKNWAVDFVSKETGTDCMAWLGIPCEKYK